MAFLNYRGWQALIFLVSVLVLGSALFLGYKAHISPCPLCLMQRWCIMGILVITGFAWWTQSSRLAGLWASLQGFFAVSGLYFAGRQWWLQLLPPEQQAACLPDWDILVQYFPWRDIIKTLFLGAPDCGVVNWRFLGLSMAQWSFLYFLGLLVFIVVAYYRGRFSKGE